MPGKELSVADLVRNESLAQLVRKRVVIARAHIWGDGGWPLSGVVFHVFDEGVVWRQVDEYRPPVGGEAENDEVDGEDSEGELGFQTFMLPTFSPSVADLLARWAQGIIEENRPARVQADEAVAG